MISAHTTIYINIKIAKAKYNKHKKIFPSLKNYSVAVFKEALEKVMILIYDSFHVVAPIKTVRIRDNTSEWFDGVAAAQKIHTLDKLYQWFKWTKFHVDEDIDKEAWDAIQRLLWKKKNTYFEEKLKANTANPKNLLEISLLRSVSERKKA